MPTVTNFLVSSLPDYVQTNREILVKSFGLVGTATRSRIGLQTGYKYLRALRDVITNILVNNRHCRLCRVACDDCLFTLGNLFRDKLADKNCSRSDND